jgi:hypothetical protein
VPASRRAARLHQNAPGSGAPLPGSRRHSNIDKPSVPEHRWARAGSGKYPPSATCPRRAQKSDAVRKRPAA